MTEYYSGFAIDQIKAAPETLKVVQTITDSSLAAVKETDVYRLRRGLCLPSATATNINALVGERLISETRREDEPILTVGDLYNVVLPFHNRQELIDKQGKMNNKPWFVATPQGDMYHHTMVSIAEGLCIHAKSIEGFESIEQLLSVLDKNGTLALSLNNRFVLDVTLQNDPNLVHTEDNGDNSILIEGNDGTSFRKFENGRHVVSLLGISDNGNILIHDSFRLPQMTTPLVMEVPVETVQHYLQYHDNAKTRGIAFGLAEEQLEDIEIFENKNLFIPRDVVNSIRELKDSRVKKEIV